MIFIIFPDLYSETFENKLQTWFFFFRLKELWIDGNRIKQIPSLIGNLKDLVHLEASVNHIDFVSDAISGCKLMQELALSTNDLKSLPEAIGGLEALVTLKLDDNQVICGCFWNAI